MCQPKLGILTALVATALSVTGCATAYRVPDYTGKFGPTSPESQSRSAETDKRPAAGKDADRGNLGKVAPANREVVIPCDKDERLASDRPVLVDTTIESPSKGRIIVVGRSLEEIEASVRAAIIAESKKDREATVARVVEPNGNVYYLVGDVGYDEIAQRGDASSRYQTSSDATSAQRRTFWSSLRPARKKDDPNVAQPQMQYDYEAPAEPISAGDVPVHELISPMLRPSNATPITDTKTTKSEWHSKVAPVKPSEPVPDTAPISTPPRNLLDVLPTNPPPFPSAVESDARRLPD